MAAVGNGHAYRQPQTWLGAVDIGYLTEEERDAILQVIQRDEQVRVKEEQRVIKLKADLRDVKRKGAKLADHSYSQRVCARCNSKMGIIFNAPTQCPVCKHKVCKNCIVSGSFSAGAKCIVCYQETKLKAETGEWFYGMMRPELRTLQDGSTLVKQAVLVKPVHFDKRNSPNRVQPEITCTPASSNSKTSSKKASSSINSYGTGSSTESRKVIPRKEGLGPAETGSIQSLRRHNFRQRTLSSEAESVPTSPQVSRQTKSLPRNLPPMSLQRHPKMADVATLLLAQHKKFKAREVDKSNGYGNGGEDVNNHSYMLSREDSLEVDEELASDSSIDSRSIDGAFEEYLQQQKDQMRSNNDAKQRWRTYTVSRSSSAPYSGDEDTPDHKEEEKDAVDKLPPTAAPRRLNEKLVRQNKFSASVPTVYQSPASPTRNGGMGSNRKISSSTVSLDYQHSRDMSSSVPNLSQSNTSLNSVGLHDLTITGEVKFSLGYNYKANFLLVNVVECRNIATADRRRKRSDPYVKCYLLPDRKHKQKTDVKKRTINPVFGKRLKFSVSHSELSTRTLELSVWHAGTFSRNLFLGEVLVPLDNWDWDSKNENWFPLRQKDALNADFAKGSVYRGDFFLALKFVPCRPSNEQKTPYGELHLLIKGAKNLMPSRSSRTVDSFVKILMQPNGQLRQKTPVISKTTSPEWNYNVRFPLQQPIEESCLQLAVCHKDRLQGSTVLGGCRLNLGPDAGEEKWMDASATESAVWQSAIDAPGQWIDSTLPLRPNV